MAAADNRESGALDHAIDVLLDGMWRDLCEHFRQRPHAPIRLSDELMRALMLRWKTQLHEAAKLGATYRNATGAHPPDHDWTEDAITLPMYRERR